MGILDDVKSRLKQLADKAPEFRDEALDKIKKYSEDGVEITRDLFADISNQVSEITASTRLQYAIKDLENNLKKAYRNLGELGFSAYLAAISCLSLSLSFAASSFFCIFSCKKSGASWSNVWWSYRNYWKY